jgi:hypothetical protein
MKMARFLFITGILVIAWSDYSTSSAITVEEQVLQLRENYVRTIKTRIFAAVPSLFA